MASFTSQSPVCRRLSVLLDCFGSADYIGEPVTIVAHSLQSAAIASTMQKDDEVTIAALLHDLGHALGMEAGFPLGMAGCGIPDHEGIGERFVKQLGFTARIQKLVKNHVTAKRYLCCKNPEYHDQLSEASKTTLKYQGGAMTPEQAAAFENDPDFEAIILMRKVDELAKDPDAHVPSLEEWFPLIDKYSSGYTGGESYTLSCQQQKHYQENGFLIVPNLLQYLGTTTSAVSGWVDEVSSWEKAEKKWLLHWELGAEGSKQLCRVENFADYHSGIGDLCRGPLRGLCTQVFGKEAALFKEKINFKLPGGAGFAAHQDSPAYTCVGLGEDHISVMVAVDTATVDNGCLQVAAGRYVKGQVPLTSDGVVEPAVEAEMDFKPVTCPAGTIMLFSGYIPHRSQTNTSSASRRAMYITYNPLCQGDLHEQYYVAKHSGSQGFSAGHTISFQNDFKGVIVD